MCPSSGPKTSLFERFAEAWPDIGGKQYRPGSDDTDTNKRISDVIQERKIWIEKQLKKPICRGDYKELLELSLLFVGFAPTANTQKENYFPPPWTNSSC